MAHNPNLNPNPKPREQALLSDVLAEKRAADRAAAEAAQAAATYTPKSKGRGTPKRSISTTPVGERPTPAEAAAGRLAAAAAAEQSVAAGTNHETPEQPLGRVCRSWARRNLHPLTAPWNGLEAWLWADLNPNAGRVSPPNVSDPPDTRRRHGHVYVGLWRSFVQARRWRRRARGAWRGRRSARRGRRRRARRARARWRRCTPTSPRSWRMWRTWATSCRCCWRPSRARSLRVRVCPRRQNQSVSANQPVGAPAKPHF